MTSTRVHCIFPKPTGKFLQSFVECENKTVFLSRQKMNNTFVYKNPHHRNLVAKLNNSVADLNFYAHRFLERAGFQSTPRTGIADIGKFRGCILPVQLSQIESQYQKILNATPETANGLFYETWVFVHDFDHIFRK